MYYEFNSLIESYLNSDPELERRLDGFYTFSGTPDGHYRRAREEASSAVARAVRCYPFGGKSLLEGRDLIEIRVRGASDDGYKGICLALERGRFKLMDRAGESPCLRLEIPAETLRLALLGRYRWLWLFSLDEVTVHAVDDLPHSDWITLLEILVAMQELVERDRDAFLRLSDGLEHSSK